MSVGRFKTKEKKSTKLYEACERCGKPKRDDLGGTLTRWMFFGIVTCECKPSEAKVYGLAAPESPQQDTGKDPDSNSGYQASDVNIDLGDRYEILETIGQGGMGTVYRVKDKVLEKEFAVKVLRDDFATDPSAIERFKREADAASELTHPNMLATYGRGSTVSGAHYIVMDLLEGESLSQLLKRETRLDAPHVIDISTQICDALSHAHMKGLIHRDLKPSNIMLTGENQGSSTVKVLDFGIAKLKATSNRETQNLTETGDLFGSPSYMSPEQCLGFAVDARSDIYSLGCMMYEMLSGQPPFAGKNPIQTVIHHLNDEPPPLSKLIPRNRTTARLQAIIMRCLEKNSAQRYQSMDQLKADLQLVADGKLPKQAKKLTLKQVPLSWPVISTILLAGGIWVSVELAALTGYSAGKEIGICIAVLGYLFSFVCASLWCTVLGQACWKKVSKVRSGETDLHEKWLTAALALLTLCVVPAVTWFYIYSSVSAVVAALQIKSPIVIMLSQGPEQAISTGVLMLSHVSIFLAFFTILGWTFIRAAHALKSSRATQRLVAYLYLGCLALFAMLGIRYLAWIPYTVSQSFGLNSNNSTPGFNLAIAMNPDFAKAYYDRGLAKVAAGDPTAIKDFDKVIALKPDQQLDSEARVQRSKIYAASGNFSGAISDLRKVQESAPAYGREYNMLLASYLRKSQQDDEAIATYTKILAKHHDFATAYQRRSELYLKKGDLRQALADMDSALLWDQNNLPYFIQRADIYEKLGETALANQDYQTVVKRYHLGLPNQSIGTEIYRNVAIAEEKLGFLDEANRYFERAGGRVPARVEDDWKTEYQY
jgi:serine/threonine protein kinase/tetratricopeptide (TPR) repeat protein